MNSHRPNQSLWIFCLRDGCLPENFIAGTFLFALLFYTWSNRVKRWTAGFLLFENLDGYPFRWVLQGMVGEKLQELLSAVSQMSALFLLFSADSIILIFSLLFLPPWILCSSQEDVPLLLLPLIFFLHMMSVVSKVTIILYLCSMFSTRGRWSIF